MTISMRLMVVFTLMFTIWATPGFAKITEISTSCGLFDCVSVFETDFQIPKDSIGKAYNIGNINPITSKAAYELGEFDVHNGNIKDVSIRLLEKNQVEVRGKISGATQNLWGFSVLGDTSQLHSTWWNSSYTYKYNISCAKMTDGIPIIVNGSVGFDIGGQQQYVWTYCSGDGEAVYFNDETDYVIANDTAIIPFDVEKGNAPGSKANLVWASYNTTWHFAEGAGTIAADSAGHFNLTANNANIWNDTGIVGNTLYPNATYVATNNTIYTTKTGNGTIEFWMNPDVTLNAGTGVYHTWFSILGSKASTHLMYYYPSHILRWLVNDGATQQILYSNLGTFNAGTWYYMAVTWGGTGLQIFINGTLDNSDSNVQALVGSSADNLFMIGGYDASTHRFDGRIDEFRTTGSVRTLAQINQSYQNMLGTAGYGTLAAYEQYIPPLMPAYNITFSSPTPADGSVVGLDYSVIINLSFANNTVVTDIYLEWEGANVTKSPSGDHAEYTTDDIAITGGTLYKYKGWVVTALGTNYTSTQTLIVSINTEDEIANRFGLNDMILVLFLVLVGVLCYGLFFR